MAQGAVSKTIGKVPNKALHSRVSYLYQAATYLAQCQLSSERVESEKTECHQETIGRLLTCGAKHSERPLQNASRLLVANLRSISLKAQMRISPTMKHSICKYCDTMLFPGSTCTSEVENKSKGGHKSWADVLVVRCNSCGRAKRTPLAAPRQKRRPARPLPDPNIKAQEIESQDQEA